MVKESEFFKRPLKRRQSSMKDSIFSMLLTMPKYRFEFYKILFPEDKEADENDFLDATTYRYLVNGRCNNIAFNKAEEYLILAETTDRWFPNILLKMFLNYNDILKRTVVDPFADEPIQLLEPFFYVVYTGDKELKDEYSYAEEFNSQKGDFDIKVKILKGGRNKGDLLDQYVNLIKRIHNLSEEKGPLACTMDDVANFVWKCISDGILADFLQEKMRDAIDIIYCMISEEYYMDCIKEDGILIGEAKAYQQLRDNHFSITQIAEMIKSTPEYVSEILDTGKSL